MNTIRKTKIICTLGPASESREMVVKLANAGMNIVRLNFSHGDHLTHGDRIKLINDVNNVSGYNLAIMLDTKGPEIRCGEMENGVLTFKKGDLVKVVRERVLGNNERFHVDCAEMYEDVKPGNYLLIDDGKMRLTVLEVADGVLSCRIENSGIIKTKKGVNVPNVTLSMPFISEKDDADLRFGCKMDVDFIAASFVRRAQDVLAIRKILLDEGKSKIQIIAKIENQEGYDNLESILEVADGVMVARGDLGVEVSTQLVPIYQKKIIKKANEMGKPVITATHMLESMMGNPRPTRAEASDVANAVLDGSDAIMLSGETAAGEYPLEAVTTMDIIATAMEEILPYRERLDLAIKSSRKTIQDAIGISVADSALQLESVKAIIAFTQGGSTAKRISKFRPSVPIFAVTFTTSVQRKLNLYWGVIPVFSDIQNSMTNDDELASIIAKDNGFKAGDYVIITAGYPTGEGTANMMKIVEVK
ncbi:MAG: pyruvate kinase [Erysipelotrichaceae bacterium]|jgi:pyruvate kinase|nr:pyruvate kinase [Erysipelotrichaceae bacterium]